MQILTQQLRSASLAALAAAAMACGGTSEPEPLATLQGTLIGTQSSAPSGGVRLALAWFPAYGPGHAMSQPKSVLTEDVVYQGSFPLNYTFNVTSAPPQAAMGDWSEGGGPDGAAVGVLLAYEDKNGNGKLDTIPANGSPVDKVLGASFDLFVGSGFAVVYYDGTLPADADPLAQSLQKGFNLVETDQVVALNTPIPIALTGGAELDLFVCDAFWDPSQSSALPCGLSFAGPPLLAGMIESGPSGSSAFFSLFDLSGNAVAASVTLNGTAVPPSFEPGVYELDDPSGVLITAGGSYAVEASVGGKVVASANVTLPGAFAITTPSAGATLQSGTGAIVEWTASAGADDYFATLVSAAGDPLDGANRRINNWTSGRIDYVGDATLTVTAANGGRYSAVFGMVTRSLEVTFAQ